MKLRVEHGVFVDTVSWVARTIPSRPSLPVLAGMKIEADRDGSVTLSSYDPDISPHVVTEAAVDDPETTLVHGRLLLDFARVLPSKPIDMELKGTRLEVACGSSHVSMQSMPLEDYPLAPSMPEASGIVDRVLWQETVAQVVMATSSDDTPPLLVSVYIEIEGKTTSLMATDHYQLAVRDLTWEPANEDASHRILVRASRLSDIAKALGSVGKVELAIDSSGRTGMISFPAVGRHNVAQLIGGEYPQTHNLLLSEATGYAVIGRQEMLDAIKRMRLVVEKNSTVRLSSSEGQVILEAGQGDNAQTSEALEATLHGEDVVMAFNPGSLQEGLGATSAPYVQLSFTSVSELVVLTAQSEIDGEDGQEFRLLFMPIRTYGG